MRLPNTANYLSWVPFLIETYGVDLFCYSFEAMFFFDGRADFSFPVGPSQQYALSRTFPVKLFSQFMSKTFGRPINVFNATYHFTEFSSFIYVVRELGALDRIMMCETSEKKWCGRCTKCAQVVLYCLALAIPQSVLDPNKFLTKSPWITTALARATGRASPWYKGLCYPGHIDSFRMVLQMIGRRADLRLTDAAQDNLDKLVQSYASEAIRMEDGIFVKNLFAQWPKEYASKVYQILSRIFPVYDSPAFSKRWGNDQVFRAEEKQAAERAVQIIEALLESSDLGGSRPVPRIAMDGG